MLGRPDRRTFHLGPIDAGVQCLIDQANDADVLASDDVQAVGDLGGGLAFLYGADYALDGALEDLYGFVSE
jgi:hypothetical protein